MVHQALVVGSGPGGLATVASLLDHGVSDIIWVDDQWCGGRLNGMYREISSNTKVGIYLDAVTSSPTCQKIINSAEPPNPYTKLEAIDREKTVQLSLAGDLIMFLMRGLISLERVEKVVDRVEEVSYSSKTHKWTAKMRSGEPVESRQVHFCTGSYPIVASFHEKYNPNLKVLELDEVLRKSRIPKLLGIDEPNPNQSPTQDQRSQDTSSAFQSDSPLRIAVIGNSHSGILAIRNLYETSPNIQIISFERRPITYAQYRQDGIVHDNTGLKGATADWSRENMEAHYPGEGRITRIRLEREESRVYEKWLPGCTHLVYAIGYARGPVPRAMVDDEEVEVEFDMHSSGFRRRRVTDGGKGGEGEIVPRLFGCGIAFPEEVEDPEGNVEAAVGVAKFYKFAERVGPLWVK